MSTLRLVASDLDGTLVGASGELSPRTRAALDACDAAGVPVVFVTGRPPRWLGGLTDDRRGLAVCANGALVVDLATGAVVEQWTLDADSVILAGERLRAAVPGAVFAVETAGGFGLEPGYVRLYDDGDPVVRGELADLLATPFVREQGVAKLLVRSAELHSDQMLALARPVLAGVASPTHSNARDGLLEISALGVSKASTLARLAARWGIEAEDVAAFGDMPNDVEMLSWAGMSYAMSDGHPEAVAAARFVAPPVEEDGVAQIVEGLLAARP